MQLYVIYLLVVFLIFNSCLRLSGGKTPENSAQHPAPKLLHRGGSQVVSLKKDCY